MCPRLSEDQVNFSSTGDTISSRFKVKPECIFFVLSILLMTPSCDSASNRSSQPDPALVLPARIDAIFSGSKAKDAPGGAVLVIKNGQVVFRQGYGITDLRSLHKIDERTNFRLASVTKQFTAMAVMLLVEDGKLHYDDRLTDILPEFADYGKSVTIRNLLNHTSGLQDYEDLMVNDLPGQEIPQIKDAGVLDLLKKQRGTKFAPGSRWDYSNSGYAVLAMIVQKISAQPFGQFLRDRIFTPVGMRNTVAYEKGTNEVRNRAYGHTKSEDGWRETDQSSTSAVLGDGGIYSSIEDMSRWDQSWERHTLLSESKLRPALTPAQSLSGDLLKGRDGKPVKYGFGWFLDPYRGHARMFHNGETIGFRNTIQRFTDDKLTIVVVCNRADVNPEALALQVADLYFGAAN
jgi:CubicO group peptidase (beta-lactamase class C family)